MKTIKLMTCALCVAVLAAFVLIGCEKVDIYSIDAPNDLQRRIDSIADSKPNTGDTTYLTIATAIVGPEDNSAGWWAYFSDYFTIPSNKLLHLEFVNHGTGVNNWNNWNLGVANAQRDAEGYQEYFVLRSDAFGWGGGMAAEGYLFDLSMITNDYPDTDEDGDIWNDFRTTMQGAYVTLEVDHTASGYVVITATAVGTNGITLTETYQQEVSATADIVSFLIADGSHFEMKKASLIPSKAVIEPPEEPVEKVTYRADMTATITTASHGVFTYTFFAEGLPYEGYGSFLLTEGGHMVMDPAETYYCALADTANSPAWFFPYSVATTVGLEDNSTPWWSAFSTYTTVVGEGYFHYKFVNYTSGANNWNNWLLALTNGQSRSSLSYKECFILRADNFGWGTYFLGDNLTNDYDWANFTTFMNGATVEISLKVSVEPQAQMKAAETFSAKTAGVSKALKPGETIE
jgi:hypothetical protein